MYFYYSTLFSPNYGSHFLSQIKRTKAILQKTPHMESSELFPTSRRNDNPYLERKRIADSTKARAETELADAQKTVKNLALKIEEANSRAKRMQQKPVENMEDSRYAQVAKEIEEIKHELGKLKLDMTRVLKEKKHAENKFNASSSKKSTLSSAVERIKKEIEELDEEHVLVEIARIEAVKEREAIEAQRTEEAKRYRTQLEEVKKKVKEIDQQNELTNELQLTLYKETNGNPDLLQTITKELDSAKTELADIKREGFNFMASMDVIRVELKQLREQKSRLEKEDEKQELIIQTLNTKILKEKAKLESVTATTEKANSIASNLSLTVEQLRTESEIAKKEYELIRSQIENIKIEIPKTESEIGLSEERLEAAMEELKTVKSSEFVTLEKLKYLTDSTVRARELTSLNKSTITITKFEHDYLTEKAVGAEEIANKKVVAAQAWVAALKANEKEILMKIQTVEKEISELSIEVEEEGGPGDEADGTMPAGRRRSVDAGWGQNGPKVVASPRRSMYKIGNMTPGKRARSQKLLSPATRQAIRSASFTKKREKVTRNLSKFLDENDE